MEHQRHQAITPDMWRELVALADIERDVLRGWADLANREHGDASPERAYHVGVKGGQLPPASMSPAPDPFEGVRHAIASKRSNSGRTAKRVVRAGRAYVVGPDPFRDADVSSDLVKLDSVTLTKLADVWIAANDPEHDAPCTCDDLTERVPLYRKGRMVIRNGEPVYRERAVRACHCRAFPTLAGTELRAFAEVGPTDSHAASVSDHRTDIAGGLVGPRDTLSRTIRGRRADGTPYVLTDHGTIGDAVSDRSVSASERMSWPTTLRLSRRPRQSDPVDTLAEDGTLRLVAPDADREHLWVGHKLVRRTPAKRGTNRARAARTAVKRAAAPWSPFVAPIREALTNGTEHVVVNGVSVRLSAPDASGRFRANLIYADGSTATVRARTADRVARAVDA